MAQFPTTGSKTKLLAPGGRSLAPAAPPDAVAPILLEFESPSAALLAQAVPARSRYTVWILFSLFMAILAVAWTLPIDRVVTSPGKVETTAPNIVMQPLETSIVRSINVHEGELVHAGDLLARLDPTIPGSDAANAEAQKASLTAEVQRLQDELDGKTYLSDGTPAGQLQEMLYTQRHAALEFKLEEYRQQIDSLQAKVEAANTDVKGYTERLAVAKTVEQKRRELERLQVGAQLDTLAATDNREEITRYLNAATASMAGAQQDLKAAQSDRDNYLQQWRVDTSQSLHDESIKLDQARDDATKANLRRNLVNLRASQDAIVLQIAQVSVGSVMQSGDQFITLVPINSPMEIDGVIDGQDAGFVHVGDSVTIKFDTFPYYTYGTARGVVQTVSADSFHEPSDVTVDTMNARTAAQTRAQQAMGTQFFRTQISIDEMRLHALPPGFRVTPGMPVHADIKVGAHTVIEYLLSRVIPPVTEGMHEP
jgi:hemolysin D